MKKILLSAFILVLNTTTFANTIFQCKTNNGKQIKLTKNGKKLTYQFGKIGKPELTLTLKKSQATHYHWAGIGRTIHYEITVPNGNVNYTVFHSLDRLEENPKGQITAGVMVELPKQKFKHIYCNPNAIQVNNLEDEFGIPKD